MKLIHLSDPHMVRPGMKLCGLDPMVRLEACVAHVNAWHADADMCVVSGDLASHGDPEAYAQLRAGLEKLAMPWRLALGNHDRLEIFGEVFPEHASEVEGFLQYELSLPGLRLLVLDTRDTSGAHGHGGRLCRKRLDWLARRLDASTEPACIVMHHPPMSVGIPSMDAIALANPEDLHAALRGRPQVRLLLHGHLHRSISGTWRGHPFSGVAGINHQVALDLVSRAKIPGSTEPPSYNLVLTQDDGIAVHRVQFMDPETRYWLD